MKFGLRKLFALFFTILILPKDSSSAKFQQGMDGGVLMRIDQSSINGFRNALAKFLPHFIDHDLELPTEYEFQVGFGDILWGAFTRNIKWSDIVYNAIMTDIADLKIDLGTQVVDIDRNLIKIDFPAFYDWWVYAYQEIDTWIIPATGVVILYLTELDINMVLDFDVEDGYLKPDFYDFSMDLGKSTLWFEEWFAEFFMW